MLARGPTVARSRRPALLRSCALLAALLLASPALDAAPAKGKGPKPPPDTTAPSIVHAPVSAFHDGEPVRFEARITDPSGVLAPSVLWRFTGQADWIPLALKPGGRENYWEATMPFAADFEYYIEAYDNEGNGPARAGDPDSPLAVQREQKRAAPEPVVVAPPSTALPPPAYAEPPPPPAPRAPTYVPARYLPVAIAGVGLALLAGGLAAYLDASSTAAALGARAADPNGLSLADHAVAKAASNQALLGSSLALAGGVATAAGLGWYVVPLFAEGAGSGGDGLATGLRSQF